MLKLRQLKQKLSVVGQEQNVLQVIAYLQCREMVNGMMGRRVNGQEEDIIELVKGKISGFLVENHSYTLLAKIKSMTILSILLLRFHGILMTNEERNLLTKTIELKKKKMLQLDSKAERQQQFQCLLYLLLELYKILFLLKTDQQTILHYYNQLHAYSQLFFNKQIKKPCLDGQQLKKILVDMQPVLNGINIYEDSNIRKELAFIHIKEEITVKEEQQQFRKSIDSLQGKQSLRSSNASQPQGLGRKGGRLKLALQPRIKKYSRKEINNSKQLSHLFEPISNQPQSINQLTNKGVQVDFLLPIKNKFYKVQFQLYFRNGFSIIDFNLTLRSWSFTIQKYRRVGIKNYLQTVSLINLSKLIQKICFSLFGNEAQFSQIHNLITDSSLIPPVYHGIQSGLIRAKTVIKQYLRRHYQEEYLMGKKFIFPTTTTKDLNLFLQNEVKETEERKMRSAFQRRKGTLILDKPPPILNQFTYIKCMIRHELSEQFFYYMFNAYFTHCLKGLDVHHFQQYEYPPDLTCFLNKLKQIAIMAQEKHKLIRTSQVVQKMLNLQHRSERVAIEKKVEYKVDEELQLSQPLKKVTVPIKSFTALRRQVVKNSKKKKGSFQTIRTKSNTYQLFTKQNEGSYIRYSNSKVIIHIPLSMANCSFKFQKKRLRMYNSIKVQCLSKQGIKNIKTSMKKKQSVKTIQQDIVLIFSRHRVVAQKKGYLIVIEYECPKGEYLYELIVGPAVRYFCILRQKVGEIQMKKVEIKDKRFYGGTLTLYRGERKPISQANHFYLSSFQ